MPEIITTPNALVQTVNGKRFYVFSGIVSVDNSDVTMIDIDNIGERDIKISFEIGGTTSTSHDFTIAIKSNGIKIYEKRFTDQFTGLHDVPLKFTLPGNTSLKVTLTGASSGPYNWYLVGYGKYLSLN